MKAAVLILVLIVVLALGGLVIYQVMDLGETLGFDTPLEETDQGLNDQGGGIADGATGDSTSDSGAGGNSSDLTASDSASSGGDQDSTGDGFIVKDGDSDGSYTSTDGVGRYTDTDRNGDPSLPSTALISDEVDRYLLGFGLLAASIYLVKSGLARRFALDVWGRIFGLDFTNFDEENPNLLARWKYRRMGQGPEISK